MSTDASLEPAVRDSRGLFIKGCPAGPGATNVRRQYELRRTLLDATSPDDLKAAWDALVGLAKRGDINALKLFLGYSIGLPTQQIEVSGRDGEPARLDLGKVAAIIMQVVGDDDGRRAKAVALIKQLGVSEGPADGPTH